MSEESENKLLFVKEQKHLHWQEVILKQLREIVINQKRLSLDRETELRLERSWVPRIFYSRRSKELLALNEKHKKIVDNTIFELKKHKHKPVIVNSGIGAKPRINLVRISSNGRFILTIHNGIHFSIWCDTPDKQGLFTQKDYEHVEFIIDAQFSKTCDRLVVAGETGRIGIWRLSNNIPEILNKNTQNTKVEEFFDKSAGFKITIEDKHIKVTALKVSKDATYLFLALTCGAVLVLKRGTFDDNYKEIDWVEARIGEISSIDILRKDCNLQEIEEGQMKLQGMEHNILNREDRRDAHIIVKETIEAKKSSHGPGIFVIGSVNGDIAFFSLKKSKNKKSAYSYNNTRINKKAHDDRINHLSISSNGNVVVSSCEKNLIQIWKYNSDDGQHIRVKCIQYFKSNIRGIKYLDKFNQIVTSCEMGFVDLLCYSKSKLIYTKYHSFETSSKITAFDVTNFGDRIVSCLDNGEIKIWGLKCSSFLYQIISEPKNYTKQITCFSLGTGPDENSKLLGIGLENGVVELWNIVNSAEFHYRQSLAKHDSKVNSISLGEYKKPIITCADDLKLLIYLYNPVFGIYRLGIELNSLHDTQVMVTKASLTMNLLLTVSSDSAILWKYGREKNKQGIEDRVLIERYVAQGTRISQDTSKFLDGDMNFKGNRIVLATSKSIVQVYSIAVRKNGDYEYKSKSKIELLNHAIAKVRIGSQQRVVLIITKKEDEEEWVFYIYSEMGDQYIKTQRINIGRLKLNTGVSSIYLPIEEKYFSVGLSNGEIQLYILNHTRGKYLLKETLYGHKSKIIMCWLPSNLHKNPFIISASLDGRLKAWGGNNSSFCDSNKLSNDVLQSFTVNESDGFVMKTYDSDNLIHQLRHEGRFTIHSSINLIYLFVLSGNPEILRKGLKKFGYKQWLYNERFDPFELAVELNNNQLINEFVHYLDKNPKEMFTMTPKRLISGLSCLNQKYKMLSIKKFLVKGQSPLGLPGNLYGINEEFVEGYKSEVFYRDHDYNKHIQGKYISPYLVDGKPKLVPVPVKYVTTSFPVRISLKSQFTMEIVESLQRENKKVILSDIRVIPLFLWGFNRKWILIHAITYILFTLGFVFLSVWCYSDEKCLSIFDGRVYSVFQITLLPIRYTLLTIIPIIWGLFLLYEYLVLTHKRYQYFTNLQKYIHIVVLGFFPFAYMIVVHDFGLYDRPWVVLLDMAYLTILGFQSIYYLRFIQGLRRMYSLIACIVFEIKQYLILLFLVISIYSLLNEPLNEMFSVTKDFLEEYIGYPEPIIQFMITKVLPFLILNMPIAILAVALKKYESTRLFSDLQTMCQILSDFGGVYRGLKRLFKSLENHKYYHFVMGELGGFDNTFAAKLGRFNENIKSGEFYEKYKINYALEKVGEFTAGFLEGGDDDGDGGGSGGGFGDYLSKGWEKVQGEEEEEENNKKKNKKKARRGATYITKDDNSKQGEKEASFLATFLGKSENENEEQMKALESEIKELLKKESQVENDLKMLRKKKKEELQSERKIHDKILEKIENGQEEESLNS